MDEDKRLEELSVAELEQLLARKRRANLLRRVEAEEASPQRPVMPAPPDGAPARPRGYRSWRVSAPLGRLPTARIVAGEPQPRFRSTAFARWQEQQRAAAGEGPRKARSWRDALLLLIEVSAVVALVALVISGMWQLESLNQQTAEALQSSVATPVAEAAVLPGSSVPPTALPLPARYQRWVTRMTPVVLPTLGPQSPTRLVIAKIGVDAPIVQGDTWEDLKKGVGHHIGSADPGTRGNMVLVAHDDVFGEIFRDLHKLEPGDTFTVYAGDRMYDYVVRAKRIVAPTEVSVMEPTSEPTATLVTCYPYRVDTHRLVVFAELAP